MIATGVSSNSESRTIMWPCKLTRKSILKVIAVFDIRFPQAEILVELQMSLAGADIKEGMIAFNHLLMQSDNSTRTRAQSRRFYAPCDVGYSWWRSFLSE